MQRGPMPSPLRKHTATPPNATVDPISMEPLGKSEDLAVVRWHRVIQERFNGGNNVDAIWQYKIVGELPNICVICQKSSQVS